MKRTTRQEANARIAEVDAQFHARMDAIKAREYEQVNDTCKADHTDEVRDLLIQAIRRDAARERQQAHKEWMNDVKPWAQQIVGANI